MICPDFYPLPDALRRRCSLPPSSLDGSQNTGSGPPGPQDACTAAQTCGELWEPRALPTWVALLASPPPLPGGGQPQSISISFPSPSAGRTLPEPTSPTPHSSHFPPYSKKTEPGPSPHREQKTAGQAAAGKTPIQQDEKQVRGGAGRPGQEEAAAEGTGKVAMAAVERRKRGQARWNRQIAFESRTQERANTRIPPEEDLIPTDFLHPAHHRDRKQHNGDRFHLETGAAASTTWELAFERSSQNFPGAA